MLRRIKPEYSSLESLKSFVEIKDSSLTCTIEIDQWVDSIVKASNKCLVIKKSATTGAKIVLVEPGVADVWGIIPNHFLNNFRRGILAVLLGWFTKSANVEMANTVDGWMHEIEN